MEQPVLFECNHQIATITLNRPERRNAINQALLHRLYDCIERVASEVDIKVAIITGQGSAFCSGLDLDCLATDNLIDPRGDGRDLVDLLAVCPKPVIGAVNGYAITGGFELALNCDFLIASETAAFADTHAKVGIQPGWGMTQLLQQAVGQRRAKQLSLSCQLLPAEQARQWGLVNEVVPAGQLLFRARQIAGEICAVNYDLALKIKQLIEFRNTHSLTASLANERDQFRSGGAIPSATA
jgi:enoyl-CoA hydratase